MKKDNQRDYTKAVTWFVVGFISFCLFAGVCLAIVNSLTNT